MVRLRQTLVKIRRYAQEMTRGARRHVHTEPVRQLEGIERYAGMWIAVKDGEVIAAAYNSHELVPMVVSMGPKGEGAVAQFVPLRSEEIVIGVG